MIKPNNERLPRVGEECQVRLNLSRQGFSPTLSVDLYNVKVIAHNVETMQMWLEFDSDTEHPFKAESHDHIIYVGDDHGHEFHLSNFNQALTAAGTTSTTQYYLVELGLSGTGLPTVEVEVSAEDASDLRKYLKVLLTGLELNLEEHKLSQRYLKLKGRGTQLLWGSPLVCSNSPDVLTCLLPMPYQRLTAHQLMNTHSNAP